MTDRRKRQSRARTNRDENSDRSCDITDELLWLDQFILLLMSRTDYSGEMEVISHVFRVGNESWGAFIEDNETAVMQKVSRKWHHQLKSLVGFHTRTVRDQNACSSMRLYAQESELKVAVIWQISMGRFTLFWKQILGCLFSIYHKVEVWLKISSREQ